MEWLDKEVVASKKDRTKSEEMCAMVMNDKFTLDSEVAGLKQQLHEMDKIESFDTIVVNSFYDIWLDAMLF